MTIANVSINNTLDEFRIIFNQLAYLVNTYSYSVDLNDTSTSNIATANLANKVYSVATGAFSKSNINASNIANVESLAISAYAAANAAGSSNTVIAAYNQANLSYSLAATAYGQANTASNVAVAAYGQANISYSLAQVAYTLANTNYSLAATAYGQANTASSLAATAYGQANTATTSAANASALAVSAYGQANTASNVAVAAYGQANTASVLAASAYDTANNAGGGWQYANSIIHASGGTTIDLTGIPTTANLVKVGITHFVANAGYDFYFRMGDSGGIETTGYDSSTNGGLFTGAIVIGSILSGHKVEGVFDLMKMPGTNTWAVGMTACAFAPSSGFGANPYSYGGQKTLSGELDRIQVSCTAGTIQSGNVVVYYQE